MDGKPYGFSLTHHLFPRKEVKELKDQKGVGAEDQWRAANGLDEQDPPASQPSSTSNGNSSGGGGGSRTLDKRGSQIPEDGKEKDGYATFFCSELVAAALRDSGLILPTYNCSYFWPGSFAVGGEVGSPLPLSVPQPCTVHSFTQQIHS